MDSTTKTIFISYNCKYVKTSVNEIRKLCDSADIVCLQETWLLPHDISYLGEIHEGFAYTGTSAVDVSSNVLQGRPFGGVAVLWRKSLFHDVCVLHSGSDRIAAIKVILGDSAFIVCSVYMPTDCADNMALFTQCLGVLSAIVEENDVDCVYMLGDYNAHPTKTFGKELLSFSHEQNWLCADQDFLNNYTDNFTFISEVNKCKSWLDHCLTTTSAWNTITNIYIDYNVYKSDHFPLIIECNINIIRTKLQVIDRPYNKVVWGVRDSDQIAEYTKYCNNTLRNIEFSDKLRQCCLHNSICDNCDHHKIIDSLYSQITAVLSEAATFSHKKNKCNTKKKVVGWNLHVSDAHREARECFRSWLEFGKPLAGHNYEMMVSSRRIFKAKLKWCIKNQNQIKMDIIAKHHQKKDFSKFWKSINKLNGKPGLPVSVNGASDHKAIATMFMQHFKTQALPISGRSGSDVGVGEGVLDSVPNREEALVYFTAREVNLFIKNMSRGKSPGHDGLSIEHLQLAGVHLPRVLSLLYNLCIKHSYLPPDLMRTIVVPIVKDKTGDVSNKNNYRPISLATVIAKVLDGLLDKQLGKHIKLHDAQFGFRAGLSTESAIFCLKETVSYYTRRRTPVYGCFLDLSRAFDLVSYRLLWDKLSATGTPHEVVNLFRHWYTHQDNSVRWAEEVSDTYRLECGVRQGGLSSPRLFCLYVDELIGGLSSMHAGCSIDGQMINNISYADDMVLLSPSVCALRRLLRVCEDYAKCHGLKYNSSKSEVMVFAAGSWPLEYVPPIFLDGCELARVNSFKYLGHVVSADLKDNCDIERERRALAVRGNMLIRRFAHCSVEVKVTLFKAYCQSFYTSGLWVSYTKSSIGALRVLYNNLFRAMVGLPRFCSASGMFADAHVNDFYAIIRNKISSVKHRILGSTNKLIGVLAGRHDSNLQRYWVSHLIHPFAKQIYFIN